MLNEKYFQDVFILHDESRHPKFIKNIIEVAQMEAHDEQVDVYKCLNAFVMDSKSDVISELSKEWASFKKIFKFQPLNLIRDYYGEKFVLYFAWTGMLLVTMFIPAIIGIVCFSIGLNTR